MTKKYFTIPIMIMMVLSIAATPMTTPGSGEVQTTGGGLQPGEYVVFDQTIPVNLVFIGYEDEQIDQDMLSSVLPGTYDPLVRYPEFYGVSGRPMGLHFDFEYNMVFANPSFENNFFRKLQHLGKPGDLTDFQQAYNDQDNNVQDVSPQVLYVDAPSVEKYLEKSSIKLGIDTKHSYTIFFVNWYGRPDFQYHVYTKTNEADPDTGYNFGELRASRKVIAWGGSHGRTWFYDLSAGPEAWTDNWYVDGTDLDGNGVEDYRMPPIWEYTSGGFRNPAMLSSDLGLVARVVGIDLLFTPSPLYDPLVTTPDLSGGKIAHVEMFEDDPGSNGLDWIDISFVHKKLARFEPYYNWGAGLEDNNPIDPGAQRAFRIFGGILVEDDCWNAFGTPFAEMFCYFDTNYAEYISAHNPEDHVVSVFAFNSTDANLGDNFGLLGFADDNWVDGTQTYVFEFDTAGYRELGYGFSNTTVHEVGHNLGLSHPHDGYDSEWDIDFGPGDDFYFAWSGNESNSIMSYMDLSYNFGRFNQDSMYRYEMAGYLNWANDLADDIMAHPNFFLVKHLYQNADSSARKAQQSFHNWNYLGAVNQAYRAYTLLLRAAAQLGIPVTSPVVQHNLAPNSQVPHEGDPIRFPDN
jgi:hypothetical protein